MMDSQENALEQGKVLDDKSVETTGEAQVQDVPTTEALAPAEKQGEEAEVTVADGEVSEADGAPEPRVYKTKQEIIERLKEIVAGDENPRKDEVDYLKTSFYNLHIAERDEQQKAYLEAG